MSRASATTTLARIPGLSFGHTYDNIFLMMTHPLISVLAGIVLEAKVLAPG